MMPEEAPVDPLLHAMEPALEPDEATDDDARGQDAPPSPTSDPSDPLSEEEMRASNAPLRGDWTDVPPGETDPSVPRPDPAVPDNPDVPPNPPTPPPDIPDLPPEAPERPTGPEPIT